MVTQLNLNAMVILSTLSLDSFLLSLTVTDTGLILIHAIQNDAGYLQWLATRNLKTFFPTASGTLYCARLNPKQSRELSSFSWLVPRLGEFLPNQQRIAAEFPESRSLHVLYQTRSAEPS